MSGSSDDDATMEPAMEYVSGGEGCEWCEDDDVETMVILKVGRWNTIPCCEACLAKLHDLCGVALSTPKKERPNASSGQG